jgi:hypothetical protein
MDDFLPFPSRDYFLMLALLVVCRGMDVLSTWVATPNLILEGNPIAKKLGWRWGLPINLGFALVLAFWPLPAIVISTTSVLVAARNFQSAWLMRSLGEQAYRDWHLERIQETRVTLYLFCLAGNTLLTAGVGAAVIYFSKTPNGMPLVPVAIGVGIIAYSIAVAFYTTMAVWRMRRMSLRQARLEQRSLARQESNAIRNGEIPALTVRGVAQVEGK